MVQPLVSVHLSTFCYGPLVNQLLHKMAGNVTEERDIYIRRMCCTSVVAIVISVACIVIGCLSIIESGPTYLFPYCLGGSAIAGIFVTILALCNISLYHKYVSNGRQHEDEDTIKHWVLKQILLISLTSISLIVGLGISGIWGMVKATDVINFEEKYTLPPPENVPYAKDNLVYAICSFVLVLVLSMVQICLWCTCLCYTDTYGFSNSNSDIYHARSYACRESTVVRARYYENCELNRNVDNQVLRENIPSFNENHVTLPSVPPRSRDFQSDIISNTRNSRTSNGSTVDTSEDRQLPPRYDQLYVEPPPSYTQVITDGAFTVSYV